MVSVIFNFYDDDDDGLIKINDAETCGGLLHIGFPIWIKSIG